MSRTDHIVDYVLGGNLQTHFNLANLGAVERRNRNSAEVNFVTIVKSPA